MKELGEFPHFGNVNPFQNRVSACAERERFLVPRAPGMTVDRMHGNIWNYRLDPGDAVYGVTAAFPTGPLDSLANGSFVRVPYRRLPRIVVRSMAELRAHERAISSRDSSVTVMWRGQTDLHDLRQWRTEDELLKLYGSTDVVEPSLLSSAARNGIDIDRYMAAWFGLLDIFLSEQGKARTGRWSRLAEEQTLDEVAMRQGYVFREWAFGVAQHYGLPSTGLDLSPDLDVAVFFALHQFTRDPGGATTITRLTSEAKPVVFLMSIFEGDLGVDKRTAPTHLVTPRASAQKAHFFRSAWGAAPNRAAERIIAIFDLIDHANWRPALSDRALFPTIAIDPFAQFLSDASARFPEIAGVVPLKNVYFTR
jgi:hypothetical protein